MSRIHEALKKAEQERANVQITEAGPAAPNAASPLEAIASWTPRIATVEPSGEGTSTATMVHPGASIIASQSSDYLRFDDLRSRCAHPEWHPDLNVNVFGNGSLSPHAAEQFRTLRSRRVQLRSAQNLKTILMTSSVPGEGKTFVTMNLAQALVRQPDRRVFIIDGAFAMCSIACTAGRAEHTGVKRLSPRRCGRVGRNSAWSGRKPLFYSWRPRS